MNLTTIDIGYLGSLPPEVRHEASEWHRALLPLVPRPRGLTSRLMDVAREMQCSHQTARRKYDAWKAAGYNIRALVNRSRLPQNESAVTPEFLEWFKARCEENQRKDAPAWREYVKRWKRGEQIPGLDNSLPRHEIPPGTGYDNLHKRAKDFFARTAMRQGLGAAMAKCGPMIFSDRSKMWLMSHMPIDDLWHDNFVTFGNQIVRTLELDAIDPYSGFLIDFGTKPRIRREDGTMDNLKERYARLLVASIFYRSGYSPRGTWIMAEHGTAAVSEHVAKVLYDHTGGLIRLRESGMTEQEQVLCGWYGRGKGNPRFKACLESIRNLKHNELANSRLIPGQTGMDVEHRPEYLHGQLKDCKKTIKAMAVLALKSPARAAAMRLNLLDYHAHFLPLLQDTYRELNARTWHNLQGWHACGHLLTEYRTTPTSDHWLTEGEFNQLPDIAKQLLLAAAAQDKRYINPRKMSPAEVWTARRHELVTLPPFVVGELLGPDCVREKSVKGAYFDEIKDIEIDPEPMLFESVITPADAFTPSVHNSTTPLPRQQLPDGKYQVFINPFDPRQLFVHDARGVCLGVAPRVQRIDSNNPDQLRHAYGYRARRVAELQRPLLKRHAGYIREEAARLAHNARVMDTSRPFTEQEKTAAAHDQQIAGYTPDTADLVEAAVVTDSPDQNFSADALL
jgi:hypothetical protein